MITIPSSIYSPEITSFINDMIKEENAKHFYTLDDIHQDEFVALCLKALDYDVDIVMSREGNVALSKYLLYYDKDELIEVKKHLIESSRDKFSSYFDKIAEDMIETGHTQSMMYAHKKPLTDQSNGETLWI